MMIAVVGPTAVGKSALAVELALRLDAEIISCDSMQFYKTLSIGTAKITESEKKGVFHHLIDILDVTQTTSVAEVQKMVRDKIDELTRRGKNIILVGGSGLYIQAILYDYVFSGAQRRVVTETDMLDKSTQELYEELMRKNSNLAVSIHPNNRRRILRSLEIADQVDESQKEQGKVLVYPFVQIIGLDAPRDVLYDRINRRVSKMMEDGLLDEAKALYASHPSHTALQAIGYKEFSPYFEGLQTLEETVKQIQQSSRRYAKRQWTWFRNKMNVKWYNVDFNHFSDTVDQIWSDLQQWQNSREIIPVDRSQ